MNGGLPWLACQRALDSPTKKDHGETTACDPVTGRYGHENRRMKTLEKGWSVGLGDEPLGPVQPRSLADGHAGRAVRLSRLVCARAFLRPSNCRLRDNAAVRNRRCRFLQIVCDTAPQFPQYRNERARVAARESVCGTSQSRPGLETKRRMKLNSAVGTAEYAENAEKSPGLVNLFAFFQ